MRVLLASPLVSLRAARALVLRMCARLGPELVAVSFGWWMLVQRRYFLVDDAYISFRYAAQLAHGNGLVWNQGAPVEGYTCLLWVLLLSLLARVFTDLALPAVLLSSLFGLGCLQLQRLIIRRTAGASAWRGAFPCLLLALLPSFAHAMTSGMEETCFAFFVVLSVHLLILGRERSVLRAWAGASFATACLIRPEGPMVAAVAICTEWLASGPPRIARVRHYAIPIAAVATTVIIHSVARYAYYGYLFPNTFYAKVIFGRVTVERGAIHLAVFMLAGGWSMLVGLPMLRRGSELRPWLVHGYALAAVYCTYLLFIGGDHPHWFRFYLPLLPLTLLATAARLEIGWQTLRGHLSNGATTWSGLNVLAACAWCFLVALASLPFSEAVEPIVGFIDPTIERVILEASNFFDGVPRDSFCAVAAVGHVGYHHLDLHILDTWGLTDTHIAHIDAAPTAKFGHDKQDLGYVAAMKPDYLSLLAPGPAAPILGYDICWPSEHPPAAIYRRNFPLAPGDEHLGLAASQTRRMEAPPRCRAPWFAIPGAQLPSK